MTQEDWEYIGLICVVFMQEAKTGFLFALLLFYLFVPIPWYSIMDFVQVYVIPDKLCVKLYWFWNLI